MDGFIDILSPSALKDLREANVEVLELIKNIDKTGVAMKAVKTPSGSNDAIKKTTESYNQLEKQFVKINKLTSEEIINQRALAQASDRQARAVSQLVGAYQNLNAKHQQAKKSLQDLVAQGRRADETQAKYNTRLKQAQREFNALDTQIKKADKAVGVFNRNVGNYPSKAIGGLTDLLSAFGIVGGASGIAMLAKDIYETTKQLQSLNMALLQVSESEEKMASTQAFLARISEAYGVELMGLTKQFTQFYVSAKDKISGQEIEDIFESVTKASASMGLTQEQTERAFLALNQMMSKGTVSAEELRGQLGEALPGAFGIMAKAMGVTEKQLGKMMKDGNVLASDVLPKFAKQLEITYNIENVKRIDNIVNAQARLANSWTALVATFSEGEGVLSRALKGAMNNLSAMLTVVNEFAKNDKQRRADELKSIASHEEKKTVIAVQEMQKRGKSEVETQEYITNQLAIESKKRRDLIIETNKLREDADKYENFLNRKNIVNQVSANNDLIAKQNGIIEGLKKLLKPDATATDTEEENDKDRLKRLKAITDALERELVLLNKLKIAQANRDLIGLNNDLESDTLYFNERLDLLDKIAQKETQIALLKYQENIRIHKDSNTQMRIDAIEFQNEIDKINKDRVDNGLKELERYYTAFEDYQNKFEGEGLKLNLFGEDPKGDFEKWRESKDKTKEGINELEQATKDWVESFRESFIGESGFTTLFDVLEGNIAKFGEDWKTTFLAVTEIAQEAFAFISEASNRNFENELSNLQQQKEISLLFAGESASAREEINRQADAKEREIKRRQAQAEKRQALFNIGVNTAQGIVSALASTPPNVPLSIAIGLIGALQATRVASQQIPQFWTGVENSKYEGLATKDERGAELHFDKKGNIKDFGQNKGAKYTYIEKGDTIWNAKKTMDALSFDNNLNNILLNSGISSAPKIEVVNQGMTDAQVDRIVSTIQNKTETTTIIDQNGFKTLVRNGNTIKEIKNNRIDGRGQRV